MIIFVIFIIVEIIFQFNPTFATAKPENPVILWNKFTTDLTLEHNLSPPKLARDYALVHISIYDSLLSSKNQNLSNTVENEKAIIAGSASKVLSYLFPDKIDKINDFASSQTTKIGKNNSISSELLKDFTYGQNVGKQIILYAKNDGSNAIFNGTIPIGECKWKGTNPVEPMAGQWKTFILTSGAEIQPPPPAKCGSKEYKMAVQQIVNASKNRTAEQIKAIHYWGDNPPPTIWNNILDNYSEHYNFNIIDSAHALAYLNVGMYDAGVSTWYTKYKYWTERPFQASPNLITAIPTPNFPAYISGHSTFSGTASTILGELFPKEQHFFESLANEANLSRFSGGIHGMQDCNEGLAVGKLIGNKVVDDMHKVRHTFIYK